MLLSSHQKKWSSVFWILLLADCAANVLNLHALHFIAKPLLMPVLILQLWQHKKAQQQEAWKYIMAGLCTAWLGDIFLLNGEQPSFFIAGLLSFLTTHILYIIYFLKYNPPLHETWYWKHPFISFTVIAYSVFFYATLLDSLGSMMIPVAIYTLTITVMLLQAMAAEKNIPKHNYRWFVAGAVLFVASDSMLAYNKFYAQVSWAGIFIMLTYGAAQWMITQAAISNKDVQKI